MRGVLNSLGSVGRSVLGDGWDGQKKSFQTSSTVVVFKCIIFPAAQYNMLLAPQRYADVIRDGCDGWCNVSKKSL